jgi:uncharacterized BrkB/YihY/UPF0761 family membrane protein
MLAVSYLYSISCRADNGLMRILHFGELLKKTGERWMHDDAFRLGAALAYYAVFSMVPLLILITIIVGFVYSGDTIEQVRGQFSGLISPEAGDLLAKGVVNAGATLKGGWAMRLLLSLSCLWAPPPLLINFRTPLKRCGTSKGGTPVDSFR